MTRQDTKEVTVTRSQLELICPALSSSYVKWREMAEEEGISEDRKRIRLEIADSMWELYAELDGYRHQ